MIQLVNNDAVASTPGDLVVCSGQSLGATKALADSSTQVVLGAWETKVDPSTPGSVINNGLVEVNCTTTVSIGDKLYLDATTAGKATKTAPAYAYFLGVVLDKRTLGTVQKATIDFNSNVVCGTIPSDIEGIRGVPATGTITCTATSTIDDNDGFTLDDGVNTAVDFEYQKSGAAATGTITCVANSLLLDNQTVTVGDGTHSVVFEFQKTANVKSTGYIMAISPDNLLDNETFTLNDGVHTATVFEFQKTVDFIKTSGTVVIDVSSLVSAAQVASAIKTAINGVTTTLTITAGTIDILKINLQNDAYGAYNTAISETVVHPGFVVSGMSGGSIFTSAGGTTVVNVIGTLTATEVATALTTAINTITTGLTVTASSSGAVISLINDAEGAAGNVTITETVVNAGFVVTGMGSGTDFTPTASTETIDIRGLTSAIQVAVKTAEVINEQELDFIIQTPTTAVVNIVNSNIGTDGNVVSTKTVGCPLTLTGMSGGTAGLL
jgi:hypothetical protein